MCPIFTQSPNSSQHDWQKGTKQASHLRSVEYRVNGMRQKCVGSFSAWANAACLAHCRSCARVRSPNAVYTYQDDEDSGDTEIQPSIVGTARSASWFFFLDDLTRCCFNVSLRRAQCIQKVNLVYRNVKNGMKVSRELSASCTTMIYLGLAPSGSSHELNMTRDELTMTMNFL